MTNWEARLTMDLIRLREEVQRVIRDLEPLAEESEEVKEALRNLKLAMPTYEPE